MAQVLWPEPCLLFQEAAEPHLGQLPGVVFADEACLIACKVTRLSGFVLEQVAILVLQASFAVVLQTFDLVAEN